MTETEHKPSSNIFEAVNAVMDQVGYVRKTRASGLNYSFAGEASLIAAIRPEMVAAGVFVVVTKVSNVVTREYTTSNNKTMVNVSLVATFRFYHVGGTYIEVEAAGEGSDAGDKATGKAMTAAYKYALRQTFCIETGDDPDRTPSEQQQAGTPATGAQPSRGGSAAQPAQPAQSAQPQRQAAQPQPQRQAAQVVAAVKPDDADPAPATWAGCIEYEKLVNEAKKARLQVNMPTIEPLKHTKGQIRAYYAKLAADIAQAKAA